MSEITFGSRYVVSSMTWHQWHQTASRSMITNLCSFFAAAKAASDHGCHEIASAARMEPETRRTTRTVSRRFIGEYYELECGEDADVRKRGYPTDRASGRKRAGPSIPFGRRAAREGGVVLGSRNRRQNPDCAPSGTSTIPTCRFSPK